MRLDCFEGDRRVIDESFRSLRKGNLVLCSEIATEANATYVQIRLVVIIVELEHSTRVEPLGDGVCS